MLTLRARKIQSSLRDNDDVRVPLPLIIRLAFFEFREILSGVGKLLPTRRSTQEWGIRVA
jgi:hypothetical protein